MNRRDNDNEDLACTTAAFAALMIGAPIGHAHADDFDVEKFGSSVEADGRPIGLGGGRPALPFEAALRGRNNHARLPMNIETSGVPLVAL
jgi:hypothetical protein